VIDDRPEWLRELGKWPVLPKQRYPVPPIKGSIRVEKTFDADSAAGLVKDYEAAISSVADADEAEELRGMILDAMTANRISPVQAVRLITSVILKIEGGTGSRRILPDGTDAPLMAYAIKEVAHG
jgi:hypothetical protein